MWDRFGHRSHFGEEKYIQRHDKDIKEKGIEGCPILELKKVEL